MTDHGNSQVVSRRRVLIVLACILSCLGMLASLMFFHMGDYSSASSDLRKSIGRVALDRHGGLLKLEPDAEGQFAIWTPAAEIPDCLRRAVVAAEDKRFYYHPGFDPIAIVRAFASNVASGRTVSGASTITQQVVRLIEPRPRTYSSKLIELLKAVKMEAQLTKEEILELYLNLSPMGGNIRGVGLAAHVYFGKSVESLNPAEAASLAVIPRSPTRLDPARQSGLKLALAKKDQLLRNMAALGWLSQRELQASTGDSIRFLKRDLPGQAPHVTDSIFRTPIPGGSRIRTTIDLEIQRETERILRSHRSRLAGLGVNQAAAVVMSVPDCELLALAGSLEYGPRDLGYNNGATARRSAGSTLKPFLYALALDKGYQAYSRIPDTFRSYRTPRGDYLPSNADRRSYGPVTIRAALGNSLNVSAVKMLESVGIHDFYRTLGRLGIVRPGDPGADHYGLGLAIGNMEVQLLELVQAYGTLANSGRFRRIGVIKGKPEDFTRIFSPEAAYVITHILSDPSARLLTFGNPGNLDFGFHMPFKTGTSANYRDSWIVGYTPRRVIGVWAGAFNGARSAGATGATACGPILQDLVRSLYKSARPSQFLAPEGIDRARICWMSGDRATPACPYTNLELVIKKNSSPPMCGLPHESERFYLGSNYARWLHRREESQGERRFMLSPQAEEREPRIASRAESFAVSAGPEPVGELAPISIVNPHDSDIFVTSRRHTNRIRFRAVARPIVSTVTWFVNGMEVAKTPPPYEFFWEPIRGKHTVHAVTPQKKAAKIVIQVE